MDFILKEYQRPSAAFDTHTLSDLNLPMEIILNILNIYSEERLEEIDDWWFGKYDTMDWNVPRRPEWPILPLLTSCKLFAEIILPTIYALVMPISHESFNKFLMNVPASSFQLMGTLNLSKFDEGDPDLGWHESLKDRVLESQLATIGQSLIDPAQTESSVSIIRRQRETWSKFHRPRVVHLIVEPGNTSTDDTLRVLDL